MFKRIIVSVLVLLCGCSATDQHINSAPSINNLPPRPQGIPLSVIQDGLDQNLKASESRINDHINQSQSAIQQNTSALVGATFGKLGEEVNGFKIGMDSLIKSNIELKAEMNTKIGDISNKMEASVNLNNQMKVQLENSIRMTNDLNNQIQAILKINAELEAKLGVVANGQVGLNNKIDSTMTQMDQKFQSGRDTNSVNTQFTHDMMLSLQNANSTTIWVCGICAAIFVVLIIATAIALVSILHKSRDRADIRANFFLKMMLKALSLIDPQHSKAIFEEVKDREPRTFFSKSD